MSSMSSVPGNLRTEADGLPTSVVGNWAEEKYRLLAIYYEMFSTGMKDKWDQRVYIDLYAGGGIARVDGTSAHLKGSPLIALTVRNPFDKYVFCEEDEELLAALKVRVKRFASTTGVSYVSGNCDERIEEIWSAVRRGGSSARVLSLCMVDPFDFGIKFSTIRRLSKLRVDFVVLLAVGMDANRNYDHYVEGNSPKIDDALGNSEWRQRWRASGAKRQNFRQFLAEEFARSMTSLGYLPTTLDRMKLVRSGEKNLPLYYLALFSRHQTAHKFWDDVLKYATDQRQLDFNG